jgi:hypothetical protein
MSRMWHPMAAIEVILENTRSESNRAHFSVTVLGKNLQPHLPIPRKFKAKSD